MSDPNPLWARIGWTLAAFLWQGVLVAFLLAAANAVLARSSSRARYAAACCAMVVLLACPIATFVSLGPSADLAPAPASTTAFRSDAAVVPAGPARTESSLSVFIRALRSGTAEVAPRLAPLWAAGVLLLSLRFVGGWTVARRLTLRRVQPAPPAVREALTRLSERLGVRKTVRVLQSAAVSVPTALGALRPVILLPVSALAGVSPEGLEAVLAHELAHIRRRDYLVNLLQTAVETLLFYHPAVWWVSRRIRIERENCCDDIAIQATGDVRAYARALVGLEEIRDRRPRLAVAATGGTLLQRIARLLPSPSPADGASRWVAVVLAAAAIGTFGAASRVPAAIVDPAIDSPHSEFDSAARPALGQASDKAAPAPKLAAPKGAKGKVSGGLAGAPAVATAVAETVVAASPSPQTSPPVGAGRAEGRSLSDDELLELRRYGVDSEFLASLNSLGYKKASLDDLIGLKIHGVYAGYISTMNSLFGRQLSLDELTSLRIHGVTPEFVKGFREAGYQDISADSAQSLRIHGATPEMAAEWGKLLGRRPSLDELTAARIHGATPEYAREMKTLGVDADLDSLVSMRIHGVTPDFVKAMKALGYARISADDATSLRIHGVTPEFAREVQSLGYKTITLDELTSFRIHGVTPDFIRDANRSAKPPLSADELLDLRIHRRYR